MFLWTVGNASPAQAYTINSTEKGRSIRWSVDTVGLRVAPSFDGMLEHGQSYAALAMALEAWRGYPGVPDIVIGDGEATPPGHHPDKGATNTIHLMADWPYEADKLAVTVLTYEVGSGRLLDADVLVNGDVDYALLSERPGEGGESTYDLAAVLTHEAGHILGLGESDADESATMWPYAHPGDTHQRTLSSDDEAGVMTAYSGPAPRPAAGCGQANITSRHRYARTGLWALLPLSLLFVRRMRRRGAASSRMLIVATAGSTAMALFALPAAGDDLSDPRQDEIKALSDLSDPTQLAVLQDAMYDSNPEVRMVVAEQLARLGHRGQRQWAEHLRGDDDARVRRAAVVALDALTTAPPGVTLRDAQQGHPLHGRLEALQIDRTALHIGRAHRTSVEQVDGLLFTHYRVTGPDGREQTLRLPGGTDGNIAQRVGQEPLPPDGVEIAVMPGSHGKQAWTYHRAGTLFGGALGDQTHAL